MIITLYKRPNLRTRCTIAVKEDIRVTLANTSDKTWFEEHNVKISMEDVGGEFALYADIGLTMDDEDENEPYEITLITNENESFGDAMHRLRELCETALAERQTAQEG